MNVKSGSLVEIVLEIGSSSKIKVKKKIFLTTTIARRSALTAGPSNSSIDLLSLAPPCFGRQVNPLVRLHLQSLAPTNLHWARVVGYGSFSFCVIHKEDMCPSSGLMMMKTFI
jgi:hypothetical protein